MPHRPSQRIAVLGGVAAGPAAVAQAQRTDPDADVVLYEQGPRISYGACEMPYYVEDRIADAETLVVLTPERFEETRGGTVCTHHRVLSVMPERRRLVVENLRAGTQHTERFDKFIFAVGAHARKPGLEGDDAPNVFPMRRLEDAIACKQYLTKNPVHHVVIFGGGYIGLEMAAALRNRGVRVTILEPTGEVLSGYLDDPLRPLVEDVLQQHQVIVRGEQATGYDRDSSGYVTAVNTDRGEKIGCQAVVLAMGIAPNTDLAERAGIRLGKTGAIATDDQMRTSVPNAWACGDCIEVTRVIDDQKIYHPLAPTAYRSARVAGTNAARKGRGEVARFPGVSGSSAVQVFDLEVAKVGLGLAEAEDAGFDAFATCIAHVSRVKIYPGAKPLHVRYITERRRGRLLGAELVGREGAGLRANVLVPLIRDGWTVAQLRDLDLIYTPPLAPAHDPLLVAASQAAKGVRY